MNFKTLIALCIFLFLGTGTIDAQKRNKPPKNPQKEALKKEAADAKKLDKEIKKVKKEHRKLQGKKTSKRMKNQKKRSGRHAFGKKDPFFQRLFQKRNYKKVRGAAK